MRFCNSSAETRVRDNVLTGPCPSLWKVSDTFLFNNIEEMYFPHDPWGKITEYAGLAPAKTPGGGSLLEVRTEPHQRYYNV